MPPPEAPTAVRSLRAQISSALTGGGGGALIDPRHSIDLETLAASRFIAAPIEALAGRKLIVCTKAPLAAALALCELDGIAARLVLCPPDVTAEQMGDVARAAGADAIVGDDPDDGAALNLTHHRVLFDPQGRADPAPRSDTEWVLFTSGTSGAPKMVAHTLQGLTGAIVAGAIAAPAPIWATFYDIRRYGGLQMLLRSLVGGTSLVLTDAEEPLGRFLDRVGRHGVTHLAGTPSHWRRALMSPALAGLALRYIRLSGEIADQAVLDALRARFPAAAIGHAYASTEAGVGFEVTDGLEGFPAALLERQDGPVQMRVMDDTLQLRSLRTARGYVGQDAPALSDAYGWVDTGDLVERRGERLHFKGRASGVINVGGLKISPEEVEAVINACPGVRMSRVTGRASPLLGALVAAEVVLADPADASGARATGARAAILAHCRDALPPHKAPASIRFVEALNLGAAGKLERRGA